jgi:hypothetical protein
LFLLCLYLAQLLPESALRCRSFAYEPKDWVTQGILTYLFSSGTYSFPSAMDLQSETFIDLAIPIIYKDILGAIISFDDQDFLVV